MLRVDSFIKRNGDHYLNSSFIINGISHKPMKSYINSISIEKFKKSKNYMLFHGDLQFDNIIYQNDNKFFYIDWRDSFADNTNGGDLYYDLAKLLKYNEWILFFETLLFQKKDANQIFKQLNKQTKDYNLKKIIKLYT